ncbi:hypothetical protein N9L86_00635 [Euryarchaeota archaeon]|nr:hypothetical protein [Euryarchaeota archaeon]
MGELLQNSIKSIQKRKKYCDDNNLPAPPRGRIDVKVNYDMKMITIEDNGIGFTDYDSALGLGRSGWSMTQQSPEAGFGYGLTALMIQSTEAKFSSVNVQGYDLRREYIDSWRVFWGHPLTPDWDWSANSNVKPRRRLAPKTTIRMRGDRGSFTALWSKIHEWHNDVRFNQHDPLDLLLGSLQWHSALGDTSTLFGRNPKEIKYKIHLTLNGNTESTALQTVGHPLENIHAALTSFPVPLGANPAGPLHLLTAHEISINRRQIPYTDDGTGNQLQAKVHIHAVTMAPAHNRTVIEGMNQYMAPFPMLEYSSDRYFISINGFPQATLCRRPQSGTNMQVHSNTIAIIDIELDNGQCMDAGRNKLARGFEAYVADKLKEQLRLLENAQQNPTPITRHQLTVVRQMARDQAINHPWAHTWNPKLSSVGREKNDESWVHHLFGSVLAQGIVKEIRPIIIGHNRDVYDLMFWNDIPINRLPTATKRNFRQSLPRNIRANNTTAFSQATTPTIPLVGELKTTTKQLTQDLARQGTRKHGGDIDLLVCWEASPQQDHAQNWVLQPKAIGDGFVRCSNYTLTHNHGNQPWEIEVLVLSDYIAEYDAAMTRGNGNNWPILP